MVEDFSKKSKQPDAPDELNKIPELPSDIADEILEVIESEPPPIPTSEKKPTRPPKIPRGALKSLSDTFIIIEDRRRPGVTINASTNIYSEKHVNEVYLQKLSRELRELIQLLLSQRYTAVRIDEWDEKSELKLQITILRNHEKADAFVNEIALLCESVKGMKLITVKEDNAADFGISAEDFEKNIVDEVEDLYIFEIDFKSLFKRKKLLEHIQYLADRLKVVIRS